MPYKLYLFDMDGTIADTDLAIVLTFVDLYKKYDPKAKPSINDLVSFSGPPIKESLLKCFPNLEQEPIFKDFCVWSVNYYKKYTTTYEYVRELFKKLKEQGNYVGIVTGKRADTCYDCIDTLNIKDYLDVVISFSDVKKGKPDPEGIIKAMGKFPDIKKEETLYIGDNFNDYLAAKNAGIDSMIVTWGPRKMSKDIKPTYFIDSFKDFFEVISNGKNN